MSEKIIAGRYRVLKNKGDSGICSTHFAEDSLNGMQLVVKMFTDTEPLGLDYIKNANLLRDAEPQGVVLAIDGGLLDDPSGFYVAYPLYDGHSLDDYLRVVGKLPLSEVVFIARCLLDAVAGLHERGFVHLFLNPHNVLYTPGSGVMIKDPALRPELFSPLLERLASYDYSFFSPELMDTRDGAGESADIFALGRIIESTLNRVEKAHLDTDSRQAYERMSEISARCLELNAEQRVPTVEAILQELPAESALPGPALANDDRRASSVAQAESALEPLEDSFFFEDGFQDEDEADRRFGMLPATPIKAKRRNKGGWFRRYDRFPVLKLTLLGAAVAMAISILVLGHDLPGKSARTAGDSVSETSGIIESEPAEEFPSPASEPEGYGQQETAAVPVIVAAGNFADGGSGESSQTTDAATGIDDRTPLASSDTPVVTSQERPVASFSVSPSSGNSPLQVWLDASSSSDPDGTIASYEWSFGGTGSALYYVFESNILPCTIPVTLTVADNQGLTSSVTQLITIY